jgi:histidine phosphotransferase ChpT
MERLAGQQETANPATPGQALDLRLVSLVSAKLCHDLLSPVSALNVIAESLEDEDPAMASEAHQLIRDSAAKCLRRLSFFRAALGLSAPIEPAQAQALMTDLLKEAKVRLNWTDRLGAKGADRERLGSIYRLALNLSYLTGALLPRGGELDVTLEHAAGPRITTVARGEGVLSDDPAVATLFQGLAADRAALETLDARFAHAYFTGRSTANLGLTLTLGQSGPKHIELCAGPPSRA